MRVPRDMLKIEERNGDMKRTVFEGNIEEESPKTVGVNDETTKVRLGRWSDVVRGGLTPFRQTTSIEQSTFLRIMNTIRTRS